MEAYRALPRWLWAGRAGVELLVLALLAWRARPLARALRRAVRGRVRTAAAIGGVAAAAAWAATLPIAATGHWWRRRYGLSEQGYGAWLGDRALSLAVTAVVVTAVVALLVALAGRLGGRWWIPSGAAVAALGVAIVLAQPAVVQPLFNRVTPLADPALAAEVERLADRLGVAVEEVVVADASRRTTTANAQVVGIGPTRRVVLHDTLLDGRFPPAEVGVVVAHELAHVARAHVWKAAAWFALFAVPALAVIAAVTERRGGLRDPALVPLALLCALALFLATLPAQNAISRRYEREADWLALVAARDPAAAASLARRLAVTGLADPTPPGWSRVLVATHPSALDRIALARAFAAR